MLATSEVPFFESSRSRAVALTVLVLKARAGVGYFSIPGLPPPSLPLRRTPRIRVFSIAGPVATVQADNLEYLRELPMVRSP